MIEEAGIREVNPGPSAAPGPQQVRICCLEGASFTLQAPIPSTSVRLLPVTTARTLGIIHIPTMGHAMGCVCRPLLLEVQGRRGRTGAVSLQDLRVSCQ